MAAIALSQYGAMTSDGASKTADFVASQIEEGRKRLQDSHTFGQKAKESLGEFYRIFTMCRHANWDGYGAEPVSPEAFRQAYRFLEALPLGTPAPSVGAEPDGHITLEWYYSPRRTLSVSISPEGELHYAALLGVKKAYGTEPFFGEAPRDVVDLIHRAVAT